MLLGMSTLKTHFCGKETLISQLYSSNSPLFLHWEQHACGGCMVGKFARESLALLQGRYIEPGKGRGDDEIEYQIS